MRDWLVAEGLEAARIVVEAEARSTRENARHCADLVAAGRFQRLTLVTERFHVLRARLLLARALTSRGLQVELRICAAPDHLGVFQLMARWLGELAKLADDIRAGPRR
jgi:hypothetical protein